MAPNLITLQASEHPIKSVTISKSSKAEVVRTFAVDLKQGQNRIEIKGLPSTIDAVRPSGLGAARLDDFLCTMGRNKFPHHIQATSSEIIRVLSVKKAALESERVVREQESHLLLRYAQTLSGEHVTPKQMSDFLQNYVVQGRNIVEAITKLNEQIVEIDCQIDAEKDNVSSKRGEADSRIDAVVSSDTDSSVTLMLTYIVGNCKWDSKYELHTTTQSGKPSRSVSLHYLATITQSTGEDWTDAALTLSTIKTDLVAKHLPQSLPLKIRPAGALKSGFAQEAEKKNAFSNFIQSQQTFFGSTAQLNTSNTGGLFGAAAPNTNTVNQSQKPVFGSSTGNSQAPVQSFGQQNAQAFASESVFGGGGGGAPLSIRNAPVQPVLFGDATPTVFGAAPSASAFGSSTAAPVVHSSNSVFALPQVPVIDPSLGAYQPELSSAYAAPLEESVDDVKQDGAPGEITEPTTIVKETPLSMSFAVCGQSTIPSDGLNHRVTLAVLPFQAKVSYISIPRDDPSIFLQCEVKNSSEYRLLAGPMSVIIDGSYISTTSITTDINPGDNFECVLGNDMSTKVTYTRSSKTVKSDGGAFSEDTNTTTYTTKISVHNKHPFAITDLLVRDCVPVSEDKRFKVILRKPFGLADAKDGKTVDLQNDGLQVGWEKLVDGKGREKEGKFEWKWKVGSGATVNLEAQYDVKVPKDVSWVIGSNRQ
ncbi:hypothetical protein BDZ97DRAFT_1821922 [Flammula alnicola]|nr:hypothetical protein BDZ97DRAFT_1821922 [Flammula alnicola]